MIFFKTLLLITLSLPAFSQELGTQNVQSPRAFEFITNLPKTWETFADETFQKDNANRLITLGLLTAFLVATDYESWKEFERYHSNDNFIHNMNWHFVSMGDGYAQVALAGAFGLYGYLFSTDSRAQRTMSQTLEVILSTGAVVQIIKHITGRESPVKATTRTGAWEPFPEQMRANSDIQKYDAVPSGHIATFYATFLVVWDNYPEYKWIPYLGYPLTVLVSQALVATGLHWWSDIPLGLALGHSFAKIVTRRNNRSEKESSTVQFATVFLPDRPATLGLRWEW